MKDVTDVQWPSALVRTNKYFKHTQRCYAGACEIPTMLLLDSDNYLELHKLFPYSVLGTLLI